MNIIIEGKHFAEEYLSRIRFYQLLAPKARSHLNINIEIIFKLQFEKYRLEFFFFFFNLHI